MEDSPRKQWVNGLLKTLKSIRIPKKLIRILVHGLLIVITLAVVQILLDTYQNNFMLFLPPIGFALFLVTSSALQPIIIGVINVIIVCRFYNAEHCQIGFWLNGLFLLLVFSTINLLMLTVYHVPLTTQVAIAEAIALSIPFGYLGKISNTTWKKQATNSSQNEKN